MLAMVQQVVLCEGNRFQGQLTSEVGPRIAYEKTVAGLAKPEHQIVRVPVVNISGPQGVIERGARRIIVRPHVARHTNPACAYGGDDSATRPDVGEPADGPLPPSKGVRSRRLRQLRYAASASPSICRPRAAGIGRPLGVGDVNVIWGKIQR